MSYIDEKISALQKAIDDLECSHPKKVVRYRLTSSGLKMLKLQCTRCGECFGDWIPHREVDDIESVEPINDGLVETYRQNVAELKKELRERQRELNKNDFHEWYKEYLHSPEWYEKRQLVFDRCDWTCEGCGIERSTIAHHITYENAGNEFLFELLGLCKKCHDRLHKKDES